MLIWKLLQADQPPAGISVKYRQAGNGEWMIPPNGSFAPSAPTVYSMTSNIFSFEAYPFSTAKRPFCGYFLRLQIRSPVHWTIYLWWKRSSLQGELLPSAAASEDEGWGADAAFGCSVGIRERRMECDLEGSGERWWISDSELCCGGTRNTDETKRVRF